MIPKSGNRLAFLTPESGRCGIFLRCGLAVRLPVSFGRRTGGDILNQAGQSADGIEDQTGVAAGFPARRFGQHGAAEPELGRFLQARGGLRPRPPPDSEISQKSPASVGSGALTGDDTKAAAAARSPAGSWIRRPPATFR